MICARCSREIEQDSNFCRLCGAAVADAGFSRAAPRRLFRSAVDRKVGGICGGLADYFDVDPTFVRLAAIILTIYPGAIFFGVLAYGIAWMVIPLSPAPPPPLQTAPTTA